VRACLPGAAAAAVAVTAVVAAPGIRLLLETELSWLQEESGCNVHVLRCDVSGDASVVSMLAAVRDMNAKGRIRGTIYAAGVTHDSLIRGGGAVLMCRACVLCLFAVLVYCA